MADKSLKIGVKVKVKAKGVAMPSPEKLPALTSAILRKQQQPEKKKVRFS